MIRPTHYLTDKIQNLIRSINFNKDLIIKFHRYPHCADTVETYTYLSPLVETSMVTHMPIVQLQKCTKACQNGALYYVRVTVYARVLL